MNNFNKVFETVKKHCQENGSVSGNGQFQNISSEVGVPSERLHFYLECIEHTGVIQYNRETETVNLTKKGEEALRVFPWEQKKTTFERMEMYKVEFIDNKAKSATPIPFGLYSDLKEFGLDGNKTVIKWYIVEAENEKDAIEIADMVVKKIWGAALGLR